MRLEKNEHPLLLLCFNIMRGTGILESRSTAQFSEPLLSSKEK